MDMGLFVELFKDLQGEIHSIAKSKGWWDTNRSDGELIALMHSELSEMLEALREGNPPYSVSHPETTGLGRLTTAEVELADVVIRAADMAGKHGWNLGLAIAQKVSYNRTREHRHGGKLF